MPFEASFTAPRKRSRRARFAEQYGVTHYDARVLCATRELANYFEAVVKAGAAAKTASNWIQGELLRRLKETGDAKPAERVAPAELAALIARVEKGDITAASGKKVFARMLETGEGAEKIIAAEGLGQISDAGEIERVVREIMEQEPANVAKYRAGNEGVMKFFVGQVMRATRGQANPQLVNETVKRLLAG